MVSCNANMINLNHVAINGNLLYMSFMPTAYTCNMDTDIHQNKLQKHGCQSDTHIYALTHALIFILFFSICICYNAEKKRIHPV